MGLLFSFAGREPAQVSPRWVPQSRRDFNSYLIEFADILKMGRDRVLGHIQVAVHSPSSNSPTRVKIAWIVAVARRHEPRLVRDFVNCCDILARCCKYGAAGPLRALSFRWGGRTYSQILHKCLFRFVIGSIPRARLLEPGSE